MKRKPISNTKISSYRLKLKNIWRTAWVERYTITMDSWGVGLIVDIITNRLGTPIGERRGLT